MNIEISLAFYFTGVPAADSHTQTIHYEALKAGSGWWPTDCSEALTVCRLGHTHIPLFSGTCCPFSWVPSAYELDSRMVSSSGSQETFPCVSQHFFCIENSRTQGSSFKDCFFPIEQCSLGMEKHVRL